MTKDGVVTIHGREYKTVALRVSEFRKLYPINEGWAVLTEMQFENKDAVLMKAEIVDPQGRTVAVGYSEELRGSSQINRTSALENCETSAIGRALAAAGFGGSEYASANEVQNAIQQQSSPPAREKSQDSNETPSPSRPLSIDLEPYRVFDIPASWPKPAVEDFSQVVSRGIKAYGDTGFSDRVVTLLTHGDYGTSKIAGIDFKQDGHRLYDDLTKMLKAHAESEGEEE
jgi:hypothetical protein